MEKDLLTIAEVSDKSGVSRERLSALCREDKISCSKMGGAWYTTVKAVTDYKQAHKDDGDDTKKCVPQYASFSGSVKDNAFTYDGVEYVASSKAADLTGYNQDYIGELARDGIIPARKVGRTWFVAKADLLAHKKEKDEMLRAVQAEAAGARKEQASPVAHTKPDTNFNVRYISESMPDLPGALVPIHTKITHDDIPKIVSKSVSRIDDIKPPQREEKSVPQHATATKRRAYQQLQENERIKHNHTEGGVIGSGSYSQALMPFVSAIVLCGIIIGSFTYTLSTDAYGIKTVLQDTYGDLLPGKTFTYR